MQSLQSYINAGTTLDLIAEFNIQPPKNLFRRLWLDIYDTCMTELSGEVYIQGISASTYRRYKQLKPRVEVSDGKQWVTVDVKSKRID